MFVRANFVDIYLQGMRDRSVRSGTELAREIKVIDWSMAGNLSNRSSGVEIPRDICTRLQGLFVLCEVQLDNNCQCLAYGILFHNWLKSNHIIVDIIYYLQLAVCLYMGVFASFSFKFASQPR